MLMFISLTQHAEVVVAVGFVGSAGAVNFEDAADGAVPVNSGWMRPVDFWPARLQHVRRWCTERLGLYSSKPLDIDNVFIFTCS